MIISIQRHH